MRWTGADQRPKMVSLLYWRFNILGRSVNFSRYPALGTLTAEI